MLPQHDSTTPVFANQSGIYQIRCLANGKVYIGSAVSIARRWRSHRDHLSRGTHHSRHLQNAWDKRGSEQFAFEVIEIVEDVERLVAAEQQHIDRIRSFDRKNGYNSSPTAGSCLGVKHTDETRAKVSAALKGVKKSPEHVAKVAARRRGKLHGDEAKAKMSAARKGRKHTPEHIANVVAGRKGYRHSPETIAKISETNKIKAPAAVAKRAANPTVRTHSPETRARISASLTGNQNAKGAQRSPETVAKISASRKGIIPTPEQRAKLSLGQKRRWERERVARETAASGRNTALEIPE